MASEFYSEIYTQPSRTNLRQQMTIRISVRTIVWSGLLTLLIFCQQRTDAQCQKIDNCKCKMPNGQTIDLSSIGNDGGNTPKFPYKQPDGQQFAVWEFSFNGCYGYTDNYCGTSVMACQRSTDHSITPGFPLGTPETADYTDGTLLKFQALGQDGQQRYVEVKLICDEKGKRDQPALKTLGEPDYNWVYKYELTSKCACPNGCGGGGGDGGGLSFGSILCILFSVLVVVYMVGGMIFMKYGRGAEGREVIPNYNVWIQMPSLVKDGTMYVVSFVRPGAGKSGYDTSI